MPLYDPFRKKDLITIQETEEYEYVQAFIRNAGRRFAKCERIVSDGIDHLVREGGPASWMRVASLFGENSPLPHAEVRHLWMVISEIFKGEKDPDLRSKYERMTLGCLVRWQISKRPEQWVTYRNDSNKVDKFTEKTITFAVYKIDNNYTPHNAPKKKSTISGLSQRFASLG